MTTVNKTEIRSTYVDVLIPFFLTNIRDNIFYKFYQGHFDEIIILLAIRQIIISAPLLST